MEFCFGFLLHFFRKREIAFARLETIAGGPADEAEESGGNIGVGFFERGQGIGVEFGAIVEWIAEIKD
jgi:hypothetical protein